MDPSIHISEAHVSDIGGRKSNQDSLLYTRLVSGDRGLSIDGDAMPPMSAHLAVVADGLGGLSHGELASGLVCEAFRFWFDDGLPQLLAAGRPDTPVFAETLKASWRRLLTVVNVTILNASVKSGDSMGSTVCGVLLLEQSGYVVYHVVSIGDTRCYLFDTSGYRQLTHDQTVAQRELEMGNITADQMENHPGGSVLLQAIGATKALVPDIISGIVPITANGLAMGAAPGDTEDGTPVSASGFLRFLLCSDGFWRGMAGETPAALATQCSHEDFHWEMEAMAERFAQIPSSDNITAVALSIESSANGAIPTAAISAATISNEPSSGSGEVTECLR